MNTTKTGLIEPMLRARRFDETLLANFEHVAGASPVGIGQEGTAAAIASARRPGDTLTVNHRNHHHLLASGTDPEIMYREIFGRDGGLQRGRSGTLHLVDPDHGILHTSAMVGMSVPLGIGMALAHQRGDTGRIAFATLGDGAMSEGVVSESFNLAVLWGLPIVFVCESNATAVGEQATPIVAARRLADLPAAHRVTAFEEDATQPRGLAARIQQAADVTRCGDGPVFVLAQTVPWPGNASFLPEAMAPVSLRAATREGVDWERSDPLLNETRALLADGASLDELLALDALITEEMERAVEAAAAAPLPPASVALDDVLGSGRCG